MSFPFACISLSASIFNNQNVTTQNPESESALLFLELMKLVMDVCRGTSLSDRACVNMMDYAGLDILMSHARSWQKSK